MKMNEQQVRKIIREEIQALTEAPGDLTIQDLPQKLQDEIYRVPLSFESTIEANLQSYILTVKNGDNEKVNDRDLNLILRVKGFKWLGTLDGNLVLAFDRLTYDR